MQPHPAHVYVIQAGWWGTHLEMPLPQGIQYSRTLKRQRHCSHLAPVAVWVPVKDLRKKGPAGEDHHFRPAIAIEVCENGVTG